jgi:hypothetical protein
LSIANSEGPILFWQRFIEGSPVSALQTQEAVQVQEAAPKNQYRETLIFSDKEVSRKD